MTAPPEVMKPIRDGLEDAARAVRAASIEGLAILRDRDGLLMGLSNHDEYVRHGVNGVVGTLGGSYDGFLQWRLAPLRPPAAMRQAACPTFGPSGPVTKASRQAIT